MKWPIVSEVSPLVKSRTSLLLAHCVDTVQETHLQMIGKNLETITAPMRLRQSFLGLGIYTQTMVEATFQIKKVKIIAAR